MQAAPVAMEGPVAKPIFHTRADGATPGERFNRKCGVAPFELYASLFAGDCAIFFETRGDIVMGTPYLFSHLRRFSLEMHI